MGFDTTLERKVAVKEYFPTAWAKRYGEDSLAVISSTDTDEKYKKGKERFIGEARAMAKMNKEPVIADVEDFFEENGKLQLIDFGCARENISGDGTMTIARQRMFPGRHIPNQRQWS